MYERLVLPEGSARYRPKAQGAAPGEDEKSNAARIRVDVHLRRSVCNSFSVAQSGSDKING
jgi:hypothetical protein